MKIEVQRILLVVFALFLITCTPRRGDKESFGKFALKLLSSNRAANSIYFMPSDTVYSKDSMFIEWARSISDEVDLDQYIERQNEEISNWRKKIAEINITKSKLEYLRSELVTRSTYYGEQGDLYVYFNVDNREHFFILLDVDSLNNRWVAFQVDTPTNKEEVEELERERRKRFANMPYKPRGLIFTEAIYEFETPKTFSSFHVTLKNSTNNTFKRIIFRVLISSNEGKSQKEIFSRTIEKNETIYPEDIIRFEISSLRDFYTGFNISNGNNFSWNAVILDAKPRPGYEDLFD